MSRRDKTLHEQKVQTLADKYSKAIDGCLMELNMKTWKFEVEASEFSHASGLFELYVELNGKDKSDFAINISHFGLVPMINCCGIVVSTHVQVASRFRNKGLGTLLNKFRIDLAKELGYGCVICTDVLHNLPQQKVLEKNGWKLIHQFENPRTYNQVAIHAINLRE